MTRATRPRFSVVVPALDEEALIGACLDSLLAQRLVRAEPGAVEIVVVDNGSRDATAAIARARGVRVVAEPRRGVCAARQAGVDAARGDIVVSTDADTTHPPGWLDRIDAAFGDRGGVVVSGDADVVHAPGRLDRIDAAFGDRGGGVVSGDADVAHPPGRLDRIDAAFGGAVEGGGFAGRGGAAPRARRWGRGGEVVAVAGPCRYVGPPWFARVFPPVGFAMIAALAATPIGPTYLTATNVAFRREGFPGYATHLTQGGDEVDLLRRLRRRGRIVWDARNPVDTSGRRLRAGLLHTLVVSYGRHYALGHAVDRLAGRAIVGGAPPVRDGPAARTRERDLRRRWRLVLCLLGGLGVAAARRRRARPGRLS